MEPSSLFCPNETLSLEIGKNLIPWVEPQDGKSKFIDELIPLLQSGILYEAGIPVPQIKSLFHKEEFFWISNDYWEAPEIKGHSFWKVDEYLILVLYHLIYPHPEEFLRLPDLYKMIEAVRSSHPLFIKDILLTTLKDTASFALLADTLLILIKEGYCIRDLHLILEIVSRYGDPRMKPQTWAEIIKKQMHPPRRGETEGLIAETYPTLNKKISTISDLNCLTSNQKKEKNR